MFNVCPGCGEYSSEKEIESNSSNGSSAICKQCGFRQPFLRLPLLIATGASGTGKTTVALQLASSMQECVCMESDILWCDEFNKPDNDYKQYRNLWLRVAKNISQAGRPVVLFGSATPGQFEQCTESRYFSEISYLAFVCSHEVLVERLKARPNWRKSGSDEVLQRMIDFNEWLIQNADQTTPKLKVIDTSKMTLDESVAATRNWISHTLSAVIPG